MCCTPGPASSSHLSPPIRLEALGLRVILEHHLFNGLQTGCTGRTDTVVAAANKLSHPELVSDFCLQTTS
jgi:hypothetical protein